MLKLFSKRYHHLNKVLISADRIKANHQAFVEYHPDKKVCHVLKSNAYGHGLKTVAELFDSFGSPFLVVDSLFEAYELQKLKVKTPILILGYTHPDNFKVKKLPFHFAVFDLDVAKILNEFQPGCSIHLFVDTGMSREGIPISEFPRFVKNVKKLNNLKIVGLTSHFADADNPRSSTFTDQQMAKYYEALEILKKEAIEPEWKHISASAGSIKIDDPTFNMVRVGLAGYGITPLEQGDPFFKKVPLQPALRFISTLSQIKIIQPGTQVGYGLTFTAEQEMTLGLLPAGYYEGVDRRLSNKGFVKLKGVFCPIVGRVSMNMTVIDISQVKKPQVGDEVEIYSHETSDQNSFLEAAKLAETIPYELLVHLAESVRRELE